jgi:hypothetical protein
MQQSKLLWALAAGCIVVMGAAGWFIGTLGRPSNLPQVQTAEPAPAPAPVIADLTREWSTTSNPNPQPVGIWSFNAETTLLSKIDSWLASPGVPGWGEPANVMGDFLPFFCQSPMDGGPANPLGSDVKTGDIVCHPTDPTNSRINQAATIAWQCVVPGTASVGGKLWPTRLIDRNNAWKLVCRGPARATQTLAAGRLPEDGTVSRDNPAVLDVHDVELHKGDLLELVLYRAETITDFAGISLTIAVVPVAAPASQPVTTRPPPPAETVSYGMPLLISLTSLGISTLTLVGVVILLLRQRSGTR